MQKTGKLKIMEKREIDNNEEKRQYLIKKK